MNIIPIKNWVLLKNINLEKKESNIIITNYKKTSYQGKVVLSGKKNKNIIKKGTNVIFKKKTCQKIKIQGKIYFLVKFKNIIAIIK